MRAVELLGNAIEPSVRPFRAILTAYAAVFALDIEFDEIKLNLADMIFVKL